MAKELPYDQDKIEVDLPGLWRYRHTFGLPDDAPVLSLGEGITPLIAAHTFDKEIFYKLEYLNPTGSFKDRITAPEISFLLSRGVESAVEDSSGNAGASFAAYAARAGIDARVFVPSSASGPKRAQIEAYGAELVPIEGPRSKTAEAVLAEVDKNGATYASHAYLPFGLAGIATIAYELLEQLGANIGTVIAPVGQGSLMLGIFKGFSALLQPGIIEELPKMVGVQAQACAPLWALQTMGPTGLNVVTEEHTIAEGVRIRRPIQGDALYQIMEQNDGLFVAVAEEKIESGREALARMGMYVEPTSAIVWNGLEQVVRQAPEPIVVILTGSGFKSP
ncbi:MAG: pyridoxal-phosphate dependent enzyme [Chloroflexi bacterium]|nr:pyridoxal-phosphate dependent enzyme [Chloroflexota bacterium]